MHTNFDALPGNARIWVFASATELSDDDDAALRRTMDKVLEKWVMKQAEIRGCYEIRDRRFLIVGADESAITMDGCSVDAMMSWIMRLQAETGLRLIDRMTLHYRDAAGAIHAVSRKRFRELVEAGEITAATPVFDTVASRIATLRGGRFELPLRDSWHAQVAGIVPHDSRT